MTFNVTDLERLSRACAQTGMSFGDFERAIATLQRPTYDTTAALGRLAALLEEHEEPPSPDSDEPAPRRRRGISLTGDLA